MSRQPEFSVIIPTYNRIGLIKETLNSVWAQTFKDYEVIVVDDGSTDGTAEWLASQGQRLKVLSQRNGGPGLARNFGSRHASGSYLAFLDSDDLWFPWTLQTYSDVALKSGTPSFIAGKPYLFSILEDLSCVRRGFTQIENFSDYLASGDAWRWWGVSSFVIRHDAFEAVKGFNEERVNGEDADLALRLGTAPGFTQVAEPVTFGYRRQTVSAVTDVAQTIAGTWASIRAEKAGRYPGGKRRAKERHRILTRHIRPVTLSCLKLGNRRDAWDIYISTLVWNFSLGRLKYLAGFLVTALVTYYRRDPVSDKK